jgi:Holliday junction resolvase
MSTRDFSSAQEKKLAEDLDGKLTPNSGGLRTSASWKSDLYTEEEKIEAKITKKDYYVLKFSDLEKLREYAAKHRGRTPVFIFEFFGKEAYVVTFCTQFPENIEVIETTAKSIKLYREDLYKLSLVGKFTGIKATRNLVIQPYVNWKEDRCK